MAPFTRVRHVLSGRVASFGHALEGLAHMVKSEPNARIHAGATLVAVGMGFGLQVSRGEWTILLLCTGMVWMAELGNTALERFADAVHPGRHLAIKRAKDLAAGAVFVSALVAAICGGLIFIPRLCQLF